MNDQEYAPMAGDSRVLYHCLGCGSLVVNMARHDEWHRTVSSHGHSYAACYGPGGEWDTTTGPVPAKQLT